MKTSLKKGISFGLTSAVITTLGLIVGLDAGTNSKIIVMTGILTIAVADAFSDALGIHISEESEGQHTAREIWESTLGTFLTKLIFALTFLIPVLLVPLKTAIIIDIIWGFLVLVIMSYQIGKQNKANPYGVIGEHVLVAFAVIIITYNLGQIIAQQIK